jgi:signal transduction histidine kinase/CheY-like chemotaxis protein
VQDTHAYSLLVNKVNLAYGLTGLALFLVTTGILFSLGRTIRHPLRKIVEAMKKDELPRYKGIHEFEFLSDNISAVMESLRKETMMLNSIYHITASKKGEEFFDEVAAAISRLFHLNSLIARVNPDGKSEHVMALSRNGTIERGFDIELKGTPCENVIEKKHMCVFEEGAYREFPGATILREMNVESFIGFAIFDRKNEVIGVVNAFGEKRSFNESDIKVLQTIGQMVAAELERLAEEKEKEQMREQIFQTQKMEAIGTLAGGIAHDFNNLLQGIMGYASVLRTKVPESDPLFRPLSIIEHLSENAAELTKQLLGFARKGRFVVKPSNINDMVEEVLSIITRTFDRVIEIRPDLKKDLWTVEVDRSQVEQVILNLCLNARDAMPGGGVLTIETSNAEIEEKSSHYPWLKAGRYVTIRVSDTGMGMSDEIKQHIFEPFFTTKETGKGTGMGLAMVYGVVKNHGGFITADSEIGKGSLFTVYFPAVRRAIEIERKVVAELPRGEGTILVADDEDYIRNLVQNVLGSLGYTVLLASNGQEAVDLYRARGDSIDLVILDLIMPKMSGYEALQRLKAMNPGVRVLMSSGYGVEGKTGINLDQAGIAGFIQKPYSSSKIADAVMQVLSSG